MVRPLFRIAMLAAWAALVLAPLTASAHTEVNVGKYALEIGWVNEPVLLGEANAIFLSVTNSETNQPVEGIATLQVAVSTGGQTRQLNLRPLGEDHHGQYAGDFIPTVRGLYTVHLSGSIEAQAVNLDQDVEEVELASDYQFPLVIRSVPELDKQVNELTSQLAAAQAQASTAQVLAIAGLAIGVIGLSLAIWALVRKR